MVQNAFGRRIDRLTIVKDDETLGGMHTRELVPLALQGREDAPFTPAEIEEVEQTIVVLLAGGCAERLAGDYRAGGARGDYEVAAELVPLLAESHGVEEHAYERELMRRTNKFVLANRLAIESLAEELLRQETLSGQSVEQLLGRLGH